MAQYPVPSPFQRLRSASSLIIGGMAVTIPVADPVTTLGGLHHIMCGIGDTGVATVPQTLHPISEGISA